MTDAITYNIQFSDPDRSYAAYYAQISTGLAAAASAWIHQIGTPATNSLDIVVSFDSSFPEGVQLTTASALYKGTVGGVNIYQEGLAPKVTTGADPNGSAADITLTINPQFLVNQLWFDPDPSSRTATVPSDKIDAQSAFMVMFGHAFAFNGFLNSSGQASAGYETTYDRYVQNNGGQLYFTGPHAEAVYGGPVPLTNGSYLHLGNAQQAGSNLKSDLMNGVGFAAGTRYSISALDTAILQDYLNPVVSDGPPTNSAPFSVPSIGVYRFLDTRYGTHFFTSSQSEAAGLVNPNASTYRPDLKPEVNTFGAVDASVGDPYEVKVYRFLDTSYGTHFFTASANEAQGLMDSTKSTYRPDLVYEPQSFFYEDSVQQPGEVAIYRFLDTANGTHFYTGDAGEAQGLTAVGTSTYRPTFVNEGISFYAPSGSYNLIS